MGRGAELGDNVRWYFLVSSLPGHPCLKAAVRTSRTFQGSVRSFCGELKAGMEMRIPGGCVGCWSTGLQMGRGGEAISLPLSSYWHGGHTLTSDDG